MAGERAPVARLPFAALTICNTNLVKRSIATQIDPNSREHKVIREFCKSEFEGPLDIDETWEKVYHVIKNVGSHSTRKKKIRRNNID